MLFQQLKPLFLEMEFDEQLSFITSYTERRQRAITQKIVSLDTSKAKKSPAKTKDKQLKVTSEQLALLQKLGLI